MDKQSTILHILPHIHLRLPDRLNHARSTMFEIFVSVKIIHTKTIVGLAYMFIFLSEQENTTSTSTTIETMKQRKNVLQKKINEMQLTYKKMSDLDCQRQKSHPKLTLEEYIELKHKSKTYFILMMGVDHDDIKSISTCLYIIMNLKFPVFNGFHSVHMMWICCQLVLRR